MAPNGLNGDETVINIKISIIGEGYVGKTSFRKQYLGQGFTTEYLATLGADFAIKNVIDTRGVNWRLQIWDIAGQPRFDKIRRNFFTGSQIAFVMYSINDKNSYALALEWVHELWDHNGRGKIPVLLIGNKIDLRKDSDEFLTTDDGISLKEKIEADSNLKVPFLETSAKTGQNIKKAFQEIIDEFVNFYNIKIH